MSRCTTSCEVFAERGDPWVTPREQAELRAQLAPKRGGPRPAVPKVPFRDPLRAKPLRSQQSIIGEQSLRLQQAIIAGLGGSHVVKPLPRVVLPQIPPEPEAKQWPVLSEAEKLEAEIQRLDRLHVEAMRKMVYSDYEHQLPLI